MPLIHHAGGGELGGKWGIAKPVWHVVVSWLRLQTPIDCIPHPYWIYTKCLSTLRCCGWAFGYALMPYHMCRWGWIWGEMGYGRVCMMLRCHGWGCKPPKTASHIHIGCIKSVWAPWDAVDGHMDMHLCRITCAGGGEFGGNGVSPSLYDIVWSWLRLRSPKDCIPHPYWMYKKCLSTLRCCGWAYGYALMPYYMCRWGWIWGKMGYGRVCMMLRCHGWGCKPPRTASHIHVGCIQSVWAPWDAVDGHCPKRVGLLRILY
jgi:hypothetical protein